MTRPDIVEKLKQALSQDISTEAQVVYVLVEIRKLIELTDQGSEYKELHFYCSWAVHSQMTKAIAREILQKFDALHPLLKDQELAEPPLALSKQVKAITSMRPLKQQLSDFLKKHELDNGIVNEGWTTFLRLYASIIQDCPLTVRSEGQEMENVEKVVVHVDDAREEIREGGLTFLLYRLRWTCYEKGGGTGTIETYFTIP